MSWTDEEIDKLAREGAANSSVEYKNEYWTEFEAMLPAAGKKDFLWIFTAILFVGLIGTSIVFNGIEKQNNGIHSDNNGTTNTVEQKASTARNVEMIKETETVESNALLNQEQVISHTNSSKQSKANNNYRTNNKVNKTSTPGSQKSASKKTNSFTTQEGIAPLSTGSTFHEELASSELKKNHFIESNTIAKEEEIVVSELALRDSHKFPYEASLMPGMEFSKQKMPARASFYINGFGGLSQSLVTPSDAISTSFGLGLGAQIQKGKFTITTGINGVWSNHKDLTLSRTAKVYGFGSSEYNYQFKFKEIYLLEAELTAGYKMGRHLINVGVRPSFIIGTKVGVVESVNDEKTIDRNEYGYVDGLNRFGVKPTLGYSFDITPSFKIGLNFGVEMLSKIEDGYLEGTNNRFPIDGQLYLRKSIRFKK